MIKEFNGIHIDIIRKKVKNFNMSVSLIDGKVRLSVPLLAREMDINNFINLRYDWIVKQKEKIASSPKLQENIYIDGENVYLFGIKYTLKIIESDKLHNISIAGDNIFLSVKKDCGEHMRTQYFNIWYRKQLKTISQDMLDKWQAELGLYCDGWTIKKMKSRWGSCNIRTRHITLNLELAKKSLECIEYVIIHELLHLKINNHGALFKQMLTKYYPDWKRIKKVLNNRI